MAADPLLDQYLALGLLVIGVGVLVVAFPGPIATMNETFDAVGSTSTDAEPSRWRRPLTRAIGVGIVLAGGWHLVGGY